MPQSLSHNLLTPLTTIMGNASSLLRPDVAWDHGQERRLLEGIVNESHRLARVVDKVLSLALMSDGILEPVFDWCDADDLVAAAAEHVDAALNLPSRLHVAADAPELPNHPHPLWADHDLLRRALTDLLDNAARHAGREGRVSVALTKAAQWITITIDDDGPGLPAPVKRAVAEAAAKHLLPTAVGTGIATALGAIRLHHGTLNFPTTATGCRCVVQLPASDPGRPGPPDNGRPSSTLGSLMSLSAARSVRFSG